MQTLALLKKRVRRFLIKLELRDLDYTLAHIAATRDNDAMVERLAHRQQAVLRSKLRALDLQ